VTGHDLRYVGPSGKSLEETHPEGTYIVAAYLVGAAR
jgi:hypothetical protein